ncbi:MAG TPA: hypothetical protein VN023_01290 [Methylovorus sp.]|nr:hypothetical protein [Methylovorus sp.]
MKKNMLLLTSLLASSAFISGCATITKDANQSVQIETFSADNQPIKGVRCSAKNDRGTWVTYTPGSVSVHRSGENLEVHCEMEDKPSGDGTVISRANGGMFGNILIGGGIGAIIDHNKGTAYTYPAWINVVMGQHLVYDRKDEVENQPLAGKSVGNTQTEVAIATQPTTPSPSK